MDPSLGLNYNVMSSIKVEIEEPSNYFDVTEYNFVNVPFVYTTRLDDMHMFKWDFRRRFRIEDIIEQITTESKPRFRGFSKYQALSENSKNSFRRLQSKIECINRKVRAWKIYKRNVKQNMQVFIKTEKTTAPISDKTNVTLNNKSSGIEKTFRNHNQSLFKTVWAAFKDVYLNKINYYYINCSGTVAGHFKIDDTRICNDFMKSFGCFRTLRFENCCWYARKKNIEILGAQCVTQCVTLQYIREQHNCTFGNCICCCRPKTIGLALSNCNTSISTDVTEKDSRISLPSGKIKIEEAINSRLQLTQYPTEHQIEINKKWKEPRFGLIHTALKNTNLMKNHVETSQSTTIIKPGFMERKNICIKNLATNELEVYECVSYDNSFTYLIVKKNGLEKEQLDTNVNTVNSELCCWVRREILLSKLKDIEVTQNIIRYIRKPHTCPPECCTCCCKIDNKRKVRLIDIDLPERVKYEKINYLQKRLEDNVNKTIVTKVQVSTSSNIHTENTNESKEPAQTDTNVNSATPDTNVNSAAPIALVTPNEDPLVNSILEKFSGVQLTINEKGKVAVQINNPMNNLSNSDLLTLSKILSYAQNHVNTLNLSRDINVKDSEQLTIDSIEKTVQTVTQNSSSSNTNPLHGTPGLSTLSREYTTSLHGLTPAPTASSHESTASSHESTASTHKSTASTHESTASSHESTATSHGLTPESTASSHGLTPESTAPLRELTPESTAPLRELTPESTAPLRELTPEPTTPEFYKSFMEVTILKKQSYQKSFQTFVSEYNKYGRKIIEGPLNENPIVSISFSTKSDTQLINLHGTTNNIIQSTSSTIHASSKIFESVNEVRRSNETAVKRKAHSEQSLAEKKLKVASTTEHTSNIFGNNNITITNPIVSIEANPTVPLTSTSSLQNVNTKGKKLLQPSHNKRIAAANRIIMENNKNVFLKPKPIPVQTNVNTLEETGFVKTLPKTEAISTQDKLVITNDDETDKIDNECILGV